MQGDILLDETSSVKHPLCLLCTRAGRLKEERVRRRLAARTELQHALREALDAGALSGGLLFETQDVLAAEMRRRYGRARGADSEGGARADRDAEGGGHGAARAERFGRGAVKPFVPKGERKLWWALMQGQSDELHRYVGYHEELGAMCRR